MKEEEEVEGGGGVSIKEELILEEILEFIYN